MNLNYIFNKEFYTCLASDESYSKHYDTTVKKICNTQFEPVSPSDEEDILMTGSELKSFRLKTQYPGLLVGIGNPHGAGVSGSESSSKNTDDGSEESSNNDIKLGFSFDYVTGLPYIPGSTVKGVLKSAFSHPELICDLLNKELSDKAVRQLSDEIFETGYDHINSDNGIRIKKRDIFFDAVIINGDENKKILGTEYITHHESKTRNPNPIQLLKVLPEVTFRFRFSLGDCIQLEVSANDKLKLFSDIITLVGIGAKTNTGFGIMKKG